MMQSVPAQGPDHSSWGKVETGVYCLAANRLKTLDLREEENQPLLHRGYRCCPFLERDFCTIISGI